MTQNVGDIRTQAASRVLYCNLAIQNTLLHLVIGLPVERNEEERGEKQERMSGEENMNSNLSARYSKYK